MKRVQYMTKTMRDILIGATGAVVAALIVAAAEAIFGALSGLLAPSVPRGAVVAFDKTECPDGWERYQLADGRFLLGSDKDGGNVNEEGGSASHRLTVEEMPTHNHDNESGKFLVQITGYHTETGTDSNENTINIRTGLPIKKAGGGQPHNNMPPYLVVSFCEKR